MLTIMSPPSQGGVRGAKKHPVTEAVLRFAIEKKGAKPGHDSARLPLRAWECDLLLWDLASSRPSGRGLR